MADKPARASTRPAVPSNVVRSIPISNSSTGAGSNASRRRQSSLSSQLTFDDEKEEGDSSDEPSSQQAVPKRTAAAITAGLPRTKSNYVNPVAINKRKSFSISSQGSSSEDFSASVGAEDSEGSFSSSPQPVPISSIVPPSHRLSTTPLFPSPLARALYDDDSIDMLEIDAQGQPEGSKHRLHQTSATGDEESDDAEEAESESSEADDEAETDRRLSMSPTTQSKFRSASAISPTRLTHPQHAASGSSSPARYIKGKSREGSSQSLTSKSSSSSLSSNYNNATSPSHERKIEYVPSSTLREREGVSAVPLAVPMSLTSDATLSLRKSYHEKQHNDLARSLDFVSHRSSASMGSGTHLISADGSESNLSRRASILATSPTHSRVPSVSQSQQPLVVVESGTTFAPMTSASRPPLQSSQSAAIIGTTSAATLGIHAESIKLQRVPTSIRIAQSIHPLITSSAGAAYSAASLAPPMTAGVSDVSPPEWANPIVPNVSPLHSTDESASASASTSPTDSPVIKGINLPGDGSVMTAQPQHILGTTAPSTDMFPSLSATASLPTIYSPLPGIPASTAGLPLDLGSPRMRSKTISSVQSDPSSIEDSSSAAKPVALGSSIIGQSPYAARLPSHLQSVVEKPRSVSHNVTPMSPSLGSTDSPSGSLTSLSARKLHNRTSIAAGSSPLVDEYAQIILQSRAAKMQKWKGTTASSSDFFDGSSTLGSDFLRTADRRRAGIPSFEAEEDITSSLHPELANPNAGTTSKEIEWTWWLDEYRKMKEAEARSRQEAHEDKHKGKDKPTEMSDSEMMPPPPIPIGKGKGRARDSGTGLVAVGENHASTVSPQSPFDSAQLSQRRGSLPLEAHSIEDELSTLERTTSLSNLDAVGSPGVSSSSRAKKRKGEKGPFAKIDAWWGAVRTSFSTQTRIPGDARTSSGSAREPTSATLNSLSSKLSLKDVSAAPPVEMPPPPFPIRKTKSRPNLGNVYGLSPVPGGNTSGSSTSSLPKDSSTIVAKGSLAPAARITRPLLRDRTSSERSQDSSTGADSEKDISESSGQRRRNPQLSLKLDPRPAFLPPHLRNSSTGTPPSAARVGRGENTPSLTPGHSPNWDRTPAPVPASTSLFSPGVLSSQIRPKLGRSNSSMAAASPAFSHANIQAHIRVRLQAAKEACDKELKKIIQGITVYVDQELARERASFSTPRVPDDHTRHSSDAENAIVTDNESQAGDTDREDGHSEHTHSRLPSRPSSALAFHSDAHYEMLTEKAQHASAPGSATSSPIVLPSGLPSLSRKASVASGPAYIARDRAHGSEQSSPRRLSTQAGSGSKRYSSALKPSDLSAALTQSLSQHSSGTESVHTSRSQSRSRSPMPSANINTSRVSSTARGGRRSAGHVTPVSKQGSDSQAGSPFVATLQAIITVATEILDTSLQTLMTKPGLCASFVFRVQKIGRAWDDHSEWPCRGFFVQLLLAIAGLSRVAEWWEAEQGFWKFDDEGEHSGAEEPVMFVTKPGSEDQPSSGRSRAPSVALPAMENRMTVSPSTIDLGEQMQLDSTTQAARMSVAGPVEVPASSASDLKTAVEEVRSATILLELSLDLADPCFQYISPIWEEVVGLDPVTCLGVPISSLLFPSEAGIFAEANRQLIADDSHTVEVKFRLRVQADDGGHEDLYEAMEGKGMLMYDREIGKPTHTMWVIRPTAPQTPSHRAKFGHPDHQRSLSDPVTPFPFAVSQGFSTESVLCRICERDIPAWFFEKHNETCVETHRLELDISETNERLSDLEQEIHTLISVVDKQSLQSSPNSPIEYRGLSMLSIQPVQERPQHVLARKLQLKLLDHILEHVQNARSINTPAVYSESDDEASVHSAHNIRLLSPNSESKTALVMAWQKPLTEDPALSQLVNDVDDSARDKVGTVNRLRNTILYAERIRQEWEARAQSALLPAVEEQSETASATMSRSQSLMRTQSMGRESYNTLSGLGFGLGSFRSSDDFGDHGQPGSLVMSDDEDASVVAANTALARMTLKSPQHLSPIPLAIPMDIRAATQSSTSSPHASPALANQSLPFENRRRSSLSTSPMLANAATPLSPRLPSAIPSARSRPSSIKDFEIIKPISKGAFGSVYLAKKKTTGDYYAIKVLKKSDMVAKNQVTNVKSERAILMLASGIDSDFVVKLFYTFQSAEYLYLVMEYLNGGDCAALIKALGSLEEDWTKSYIAEVILGVEELHKRGIVHRDLKPDNLLIDAKGHLKLTDFGLSKIGLLGRQSRGVQFHNPRRSAQRSEASTPSETAGVVGLNSSTSSQRNSYFPSHQDGADSESSGSDAVMRQRGVSSATGSNSGLVEAGVSNISGQTRFAQGTPDYLAPESILGLGSGDAVDYWAIGVITYEFLYGVPPFHADTPDLVFENILCRRVDWHLEEFEELSPEVHDFMDRLMCLDPEKRLGASGIEELKSHPFMRDVDWANIRKGEAAFVPVAQDPENTDYFDPRGVTAQNFENDAPAVAASKRSSLTQSKPHEPPESKEQSLHAPLKKADSDPAVMRTEQEATAPPLITSPRRERSETAPASAPFSEGIENSDFGTFNFKNLDVLKQANQEVIKRLRSEHANVPLSAMLFNADQKRSASISIDTRALLLDSPPPGSSGSAASTPSKSASGSWSAHSRRPSELGSRGRGSPVLQDMPMLPRHSRRNSLPSRLRSASYALANTDKSNFSRRPSLFDSDTPPSSVSSPASKHALLPSAQLSDTTPTIEQGSAPKTVDVLIAEDNPISSKVLETILVRLGCRCVVVHNGEEVVRCTMGELVFDVIFLDMLMPILDGESAARMIKSTNNANSATPIVAVTSYELSAPELNIDPNSTMFAAILTKPVSKDSVLSTLRKLGFNINMSVMPSRSASKQNSPVQKTRAQEVVTKA